MGGMQEVGGSAYISSPIIVRLLRRCLAAGCFHSGLCACLALLSMMLSILGPIWIYVISLPVACSSSQASLS